MYSQGLIGADTTTEETEEFLAAFGHGRPVPIAGRDALQVHAVIDAMERAAKSGQIEEVMV